MIVRRALVPTLIALGFAGCGGASHSPGSSGESIASLRARGLRALIVASDLPAGWAAKPRGQVGHVERDLAACLHVPASGLDESPAAVRSPRFHRVGAGGSIGNTVVIAASPAEADLGFSLFNRPRTPSCFALAVRGLFTEELSPRVNARARLGPLHVQRTAVVSESDASIGYRIIVPVAVGSLRLRGVLDAIVLRVGRGLSYVLYGGTSPVDPATERRLNILITQRLRAALAAG